MTSDRSFKNCQSCGMPLRKDAAGGGTNADGTRNRMYCSHCYARGRFTLPRLTASQMQDRVRGKLREQGFPGFVAGFFVRRIPKLERWAGPSGR